MFFCCVQPAVSVSANEGSEMDQSYHGGGGPVHEAGGVHLTETSWTNWTEICTVFKTVNAIDALQGGGWGWGGCLWTPEVIVWRFIKAQVQSAVLAPTCVISMFPLLFWDVSRFTDSEILLRGLETIVFYDLLYNTKQQDVMKMHQFFLFLWSCPVSL